MTDTTAPITKITALKSIHIAILEDGTPGEAQIQRVERWTNCPEGLSLPDTYLPIERFSLAAATAEERAALDAVLGSAATESAAQLEALGNAHGVLKTEAQALQGQLDEARDEVKRLNVLLSAREADLTDVEALKASHAAALEDALTTLRTSLNTERQEALAQAQGVFDATLAEAKKAHEAELAAITVAPDSPKADRTQALILAEARRVFEQEASEIEKTPEDA
jgi:hypothetical protein